IPLRPTVRYRRDEGHVDGPAVSQNDGRIPRLEMSRSVDRRILCIELLVREERNEPRRLTQALSAIGFRNRWSRPRSDHRWHLPALPLPEENPRSAVPCR